MAVIEQNVIQFFPMAQSGAPRNMFGGAVKHQIIFSDKARCNHQFGHAGNILRMDQQVGLRRPITNVGVTQHLQMTQQAARTYRRDVTQILNMWQTARTVKAFERLSQFLPLSQSVSGTVAKPGSNTLVFTEVLTYSIVRSIHVTQTLVFSSHVADYETNPNFIGSATVSLGGPNGLPSFVR